MSSRNFGKVAVQKAPKKERKEFDEEDMAFQQKRKEDEKKLKEMKNLASQKGALKTKK